MQTISHITVDGGEVVQVNLMQVVGCKDCRRSIMFGKNKFGRWITIERVGVDDYRLHVKICKGKKKLDIKPYYAA